jgi:hypothetical protein
VEFLKDSGIAIDNGVIRIITEDGELIRALTLDPSRSYQPLGGRWPVHNVLQQVSDMS